MRDKEMLPPLEADARYHTAMESLRAKDEWSLWVQLDKCRISDKKAKKVEGFFSPKSASSVPLISWIVVSIRIWLFGLPEKYQFSGIWLWLVREWESESCCTAVLSTLPYSDFVLARFPPSLSPPSR